MKINFQEPNLYILRMILIGLIRTIRHHYEQGMELATLRVKCQGNRPAFLKSISAINLSENDAEIIEAFAVKFHQANKELLTTVPEMDKAILLALLAGNKDHIELMCGLAKPRTTDQFLILVCENFLPGVFALENLEIPAPDFRTQALKPIQPIPFTEASRYEPEPHPSQVKDHRAQSTPEPVEC